MTGASHSGSDTWGFSFLGVFFRADSVLSVSFCRVLTELVSKMRDMLMDKTELGCLRAIVLFNPGTCLALLSWPLLAAVLSFGLLFFPKKPRWK